MQGTVSIAVQEPDLKRAEADCPESVVLGSQPHRFSTQEDLAQVDPLSLPLDRSIGPDPAHSRPGLVFRGVHPCGIRSYRRAVSPSWGLLTQCLMGSLLVVAGTKGLEGSLLLQPVGLGWARGLRLQRPVESFQPPVLFRMSGLGALWEDPQLKPESTEGRPWGQSLKKPEGGPLNLG